jgi:hypothetical protein
VTAPVGLAVAPGPEGGVLDALEGELRRVRLALDGVAVPAPLPCPPLDALARRFGLTPFERSVVALCAGVALDPEIARRCAEAGGDPRGRWASFGLALALFDEAHWSALAPSAPLRRWRLVRLEAGSGSPGRRPLLLDERVLHLLVGVDHLDADLDGIVREIAPPSGLAPSHAGSAAEIARELADGLGAGRWPAIALCARDPAPALEVAASACARAGLRALVLDASALPVEATAAFALARLCEREAALAGAALVVEAHDAERPAPRRLAEGLEAALVVLARDPMPGLERARRIDLPAAPVAERRALWRAGLGERAVRLEGGIDRVARQFDLEPADVRSACSDALAGDDAGLAERLWAACCVRARPRLDGLAQRIEAAAGWENLVLPEPQRRTLEEIAAQVRNRSRVYDDWGFAGRGSRGLGIAALFCGPSGTGKTMAAEVLARDLRLDLYRIDLSAVVSKYIGETEKNLRGVFDAAERGGAVLLFDEADALFGRRTEVRDSHDRFANIEISYLLQRMEAYRGLAILTTNQRSALDAAFLRRLRFVIEFPFPEHGERAAIWRRAFPRATPTDGLDADRLARLLIPGGNIRNVALGAAFLAADAGEAVCMAHVERAARSEYAKLERSPTATELEAWS